jgi:hypothetical protein
MTPIIFQRSSMAAHLSMMRLLLILALVFVSIAACRTPTTEQPVMARGTNGDTSSSPTRHESVRWQANEATIQGVRGMQGLTAGYPGNGLAGGLLRDSLQERMALIFEQCTMEGEAHEALHEYLLPLIGIFRELPDDPKRSQLDSITAHLSRFDEQFR